MRKVDYFELTEEDIVNIWRTRDIDEYISKLEYAKQQLVDFDREMNCIAEDMYKHYLKCLDLKARDIPDYINSTNIPASFIIYELLKYSGVIPNIQQDIKNRLKQWKNSKLAKEVRKQMYN